MDPSVRGCKGNVLPLELQRTRQQYGPQCSWYGVGDRTAVRHRAHLSNRRQDPCTPDTTRRCNFPPAIRARSAALPNVGPRSPPLQLHLISRLTMRIAPLALFLNFRGWS